MINKIKFFALALATAGLISSCESTGEYETTDSGLQYKVLRDGEGVQPLDGQFMVIDILVKNDKDSMIYASSMNLRPEIVQYFDSIFIKNASVEEAFGMIQKGDSINFRIMADSVYRGVMTPPGVTKGTFITINMTVQEVVNKEDLRTWQAAFGAKQREAMARKAEIQIQTDKKIINDYLAEKNIKADSTASGLRYVITQPGSGDNARAGQTVKVHYTGMLLNGSKFDSSVDRGQPFEFPLGARRVIKGWDEGIALLNKGAKATLYIPSSLAYGANAQGRDIPANSILVFEVELIDFN